MLFDRKATIFFNDKSKIDGKILSVENNIFNEFIFIETEDNIHAFSKDNICDIVWRKEDLTM